MSRADPAPWRREPYRLLFPLGALLAWAGVLPWLFFALGATALYQPIFHSLGWRASFHPIAQVEGFLTCIAAAFLFTFLPRRTATAPAAGWQIAVAVLAPLAAVGCAWLEKWAAAQVVWLLLLFVLVEFTLRRMRAAPPLQPGFIWVGVGLLMGAAGAVLAAAGQGLDPGRFWIHLAGRGLLLQGLFTGLVLGTADLLATRHARSWWALALHALGSAVFFASFFVEQLVSLQLGFALRAVVTFFAAAPLQAELTDLPGLQGSLARLSLWMLPLGNLWVAVSPEHRRAGMHIVFLGCFAALALAASTQVRAAPAVRPWRVALAAGLLAVALVARLLLDVDPARFHLWLGTSAAAFLGATVPWAALTLSRRA